MLKVSDQIAKDLQKTANELPKGSITKIAEMCGMSQSYVSQFFQGKFEISIDNEKIIDAAISILEEVVTRDNRVHKKLNEALSINKA